MKIAHISDIHWRGIARHNEYTNAFNKLFKMLKKIKPDIIVNTGDTFHTKTQGITPEVIERLGWMFDRLSSIAPTYTMLGNHDGNLNNPNRKDTISPIHQLVKNKRTFLLKESKVCSINEQFNLCVFSPFDKRWQSLKPEKNKVNIALFHGPVLGSKFDNGYSIPEYLTDAKLVDFGKYDFVLLGDIHKHQHIAYKLDKDGDVKPWASYPGSLIQQTHGEEETKGFLVWDIRSKNDWDVEFHELKNEQPFVTIPWLGSVEDTIENVYDLRGKKEAFLPGSRFRISSSQPIPHLQVRQIFETLKKEHKAESVVFKNDMIFKMNNISTNSVDITKKSLKDDPSSIVRLYHEFINIHKEDYDLTADQLSLAEKYIEKYLSRLTNTTSKNKSTIQKVWSIRWIEFSNVFKYGDNNKISFDNAPGLVGIFGPNRIGKSSIIGVIMYALFNTTDRGPVKNDHIINQQKDSCKAKARFSVNGIDYEVERETKRLLNRKGERTGKAVTKVNLYEIHHDAKNKEVRKIETSISRDETDKKIRKLIGSSEDFLLTALSAQEDINRFVRSGPTERKKTLTRFLEVDIFDDLYKYAKKDIEELNIKSSYISETDWNSKYNNLKEEISSYKEQIKKLNEESKKLYERRDEIKIWLADHEKAGSEKSLDKLEKLKAEIDSFEEDLDTKNSQLLSKRKQIKKLENETKKLNEKLLSVDIDDLLQDKESFLEIEKTTKTHEYSLKSEQKILEDQKKSVKKLETVPCGESFPTCRFIQDSHQNKKKIDSQKKKVEKLSEALESSQVLLEKYLKRDIDDKIEEYSNTQTNIKINEAEIKSLKESKCNVENDVKYLKSKIKATKRDLEELTSKVDILESKEYQNKKNDLDKVDNELSNIETKKQKVYVELGGRKQKIDSLLEEKTKLSNTINKINVMKSVKDAFSKNGIQALILKTQLPAINNELAKILQANVSFNVELSTDTNSNVMDIFIEDEHSKRVIESCSGMEKTLVSLALRAGLNNISSIPRPDVFIIDEGFGALDETNYPNCLSVLLLLKNYFKTVLVISHINTIKEVVDKVIEVSTDGIESKVNEV